MEEEGESGRREDKGSLWPSLPSLSVSFLRLVWKSLIRKLPSLVPAYKMAVMGQCLPQSTLLEPVPETSSS